MTIYTLSYFLDRLRVSWLRFQARFSAGKQRELEFLQNGWRRYDARINYESNKPPFRMMTQAERFDSAKDATNWLHSKRSLLETDGFNVVSEYVTDNVYGGFVSF